MSLLDTMLRAKAATYLGTSIVALTDAEYHQYLTNTIDFRYPNLKVWSTIADEVPSSDTDGRKEAISLAIQTMDTQLANAQDVINVLVANLDKLNTLYKQLSFQVPVEDYEPLFEWWLGVPTGPQSCSRDVGDLRGMFTVGKGDEWEYDLESAILLFQNAQSDYIPLITGYACAETLRRLRLNA